MTVKKGLVLLLFGLIIFGCAKGPKPEDAIKEITKWLSDYFEVQRVEITATRFEKEEVKVRARVSVKLTYLIEESFIASQLFGIEGETGDTATTKELVFSFKKYDTGWKIEEGPISQENKVAIKVERNLVEQTVQRIAINSCVADVDFMRTIVAIYAVDHETYKIGTGSLSGASGFATFTNILSEYASLTPFGDDFTDFTYRGDDDNFHMTIRAKDRNRTKVHGTLDRVWHE